MTVQVKISSRAPDEALHGLESIREQLVDHDTDTVLVVAKVRTLRVNRESEKGGLMVPTVRILAWEPLTGDLADAAITLYEKAHAGRTGDDMLPIVYVEDEESGQVRKVEPREPDRWLDPAARDDIPVPGDDDGALEDAAAAEDTEPDPLIGPDATATSEYVLRYVDDTGWLVGVVGELPVGVADRSLDEDPTGAMDWASGVVREATGREVIRWQHVWGRGHVAVLVDEEPGEHVGADEQWAEGLHQIREELIAEDGKALCVHCDTTLTQQDGTGNWLDAAGFPARDGHTHEPAEQAVPS